MLHLINYLQLILLLSTQTSRPAFTRAINKGVICNEKLLLYGESTLFQIFLNFAV